MVRRSAASVVVALLSGGLLPAAATAQVQKFMLGPGSNVGAESQVVPQDCVTAEDGSITCNTKVVNPPGTTRAKPIYSPWDQ
ncbi:MAG: hypothetical protein VKK98_10355 [Cyanobacteriota bacterium]|nr:hypothetical protein [Cyanobacteriota bacterium]